MPEGEFRPQLVSPLTIGAGGVGAVAGLETDAAFGKGAAASAVGVVSEPPPQAMRSAGRLSVKSFKPKWLLFLIRTKLGMTVMFMNKLSACQMPLCAMSCNQTLEDV